MVLPMVASDLVLAVKNGPPGMWRALSSPGHLAPHSTWLLLTLMVAAALLTWTLWRARRRGTHGQGEPTARVVDLAGRRRSAEARRRFGPR